MLRSSPYGPVAHINGKKLPMQGPTPQCRCGECLEYRADSTRIRAEERKVLKHMSPEDLEKYGLLPR